MSINKHTFFCRDLDCEKEVEMSGKACEDHETDSTTECPGCGMELFIGANGYCSYCWTERFGEDSPVVHVCHGEWDYERGIRVCDDRDDPACPQSCQRKCTCDGSGRMCPTCDEESSDPCRGCGSRSLWSDTYCLKCYEVRYGPINPVPPPLPPSPEPRHTSLESMRAEIAEIEVRLRGGLTKGQRDDWSWLLQNRRADLAEAEKEMWEGYDQDDLRKLDRASRY